MIWRMEPPTAVIECATKGHEGNLTEAVQQQLVTMLQSHPVLVFAADRAYSLRLLKLLITEAERGPRGEVWEELYPLYVDALGAAKGRGDGGEGEEAEEGAEVQQEGEPSHAVGAASTLL
ncbi:unnamed protein product [Closterium sp. NIES-64]|nr:unnamed protein product [Closterium sp. NIES-64]